MGNALFHIQACIFDDYPLVVLFHPTSFEKASAMMPILAVEMLEVQELAGSKWKGKYPRGGSKKLANLVAEMIFILGGHGMKEGANF